jgi:hypothetical protein
MIKNVYCIHVKCPLFFCPILIKYEFSPHIFEKCSDIKFHENPSRGGREFFHANGQTDGQSDRHDEANSRS